MRCSIDRVATAYIKGWEKKLARVQMAAEHAVRRRAASGVGLFRFGQTALFGLGEQRVEIDWRQHQGREAAT